MEIDNLYEQLSKHIPISCILKNEPMKKHTSFRIGGPADLLIKVSNVNQVRVAIFECEKLGVPYYVFGNGSNLLVQDKGFRGLLIKVSENFSKIEINKNVVRAQAGALLSVAAKASMDAGLSGLEFAAGIPGTIGGAIAMNAGAYSSEMKHVVISALVLNKKGEEILLTNEALSFSYRSSIIQREELVVLEASMELKFGDPEKIKSMAEEYANLRKTKQPLYLPNAGSIFKRPPGNYAGKLIDEAGLRGLTVGDAQVSDLHCGFIVNIGNATANDVITLISLVKNRVKENSGVDLLLEVKVIGETS